MATRDVETIQALRRDVALQISRCVRRLALNQRAAAKLFGIPQPTLSKIANGRVSDMSLELLIRVAVRAGLPVVLQTGQVPEEAGAFVSIERAPTRSKAGSRLAEAARASLIARTRRLTPEQRLSAFFEHTQLVSALHEAAHSTEATRPRNARRPR